MQLAQGKIERVIRDPIVCISSHRVNCHSFKSRTSWKKRTLGGGRAWRNYSIISDSVHSAHYVRVISAAFTPRCVIYPVVIGFFFHSTVFLSYPGISAGDTESLLHVRRLSCFQKPCDFFETQYLDLLARSDYPWKLLLLLRDNFWRRFALRVLRSGDISIYRIFHRDLRVSFKLFQLKILYSYVTTCRIGVIVEIVFNLGYERERIIVLIRPAS